MMGQDYKSDIIATRAGGLGSSDAKMVAKIGEHQSLSYADKERIAQMKGLAERPQMTSAAMDNGDYIERCIYNSVCQVYPDAASNPYYRSEQLSTSYGFNVLCHIDIEAINGDDLYWVECKATRADTEHTRETYIHQLEWEWMLLEERGKELGKTPHLLLAHYHVDALGEFDPNRLITVAIEPMPSVRKLLMQGLQYISSIYADFTWEPKTELEATDLPEQQRSALSRWLNRQRKIKAWEEEDKQIKEGLLLMMHDMGVKSIRTDMALFTVKEGYTATKIDTKKVQRLYPEVYEDCKFASEIKPALQVKLL